MATKSGICKLCLREGRLRNSHVLPEFFYKSLYDEKHTLVKVSPLPGEKDETIQKGLREYMLCQACEAHLSKYETYGAKILQKLPSTQLNKPGDIIPIHNVDYQRFKVFQMSLIWRASVSTRPEFINVSLGSHEEQIRQMLITENPGKSWEYNCVMVGFRGDNVWREVIKVPGECKIAGCDAYHLILWGMAWFYILPSSSDEFRNQNSSLSESGVLPIRIASKTAEEVFNDTIIKYRALGKLLD